MGYKATEAQIRTIPIFVVAAVICLGIAYTTDRLKHRYTFVMCGLAISAVGYSLLLGQQHLSVGVKYFALFLVVGGGLSVQPITIAWLANNVSGHYKRSVAAATQIGLGNGEKYHVPLSSCLWVIIVGEDLLFGLVTYPTGSLIPQERLMPHPFETLLTFM